MRRADIDPDQLAELIDQATDIGLHVRLHTTVRGECSFDIGGHRLADMEAARQHLAALATHRDTFAAV